MSGWTPVTEDTLKSHPPAGWTPVQEPEKPGILERANELAGKALTSAGLPRSIAEIPDWFKGLKNLNISHLFVEPIKKAIDNPTQENIAGAVPYFGPMAVSMSKDIQKHDILGAGATLIGGLAGVKGAGELSPALEARAALKTAKQGLAPGATVAERLYTSALKPSTTLSTTERTGVAQTALEKGIPITDQGVQKIFSLLDDLQSKTKAAIAASPSAPINKFAVASRLTPLAKRLGTQVTPTADVSAVSEAGQEFLEGQPTNIPATQAQALKTGTYQALGGKSYGELKGASIEAQKALARGLKEELENQFPELKGLNAQQSKLYALDEQLNRAVNRAANREPIGLGTPLAATAVGVATGSAPAAMAASALYEALRFPGVRSKLAIMLNAGSKGKLSLTAANARVAAYSSALGAQTSQQNTGATQEQ